MMTFEKVRGERSYDIKLYDRKREGEVRFLSNGRPNDLSVFFLNSYF